MSHFFLTILRRRRPIRRRILKPLSRNTLPNLKQPPPDPTMLNGEMSAPRWELGALTKKQLQIDTMLAVERNISPCSKPTLSRASRKCRMHATPSETIKDFRSSSSLLHPSLPEFRRGRIFDRWNARGGRKYVLQPLQKRVRAWPSEDGAKDQKYVSKARDVKYKEHENANFEEVRR